MLLLVLLSPGLPFIIMFVYEFKTQSGNSCPFSALRSHIHIYTHTHLHNWAWAAAVFIHQKGHLARSRSTIYTITAKYYWWIWFRSLWMHDCFLLALPPAQSFFFTSSIHLSFFSIIFSLDMVVVFFFFFVLFYFSSIIIHFTHMINLDTNPREWIRCISSGNDDESERKVRPLVIVWRCGARSHFGLF